MRTSRMQIGMITWLMLVMSIPCAAQYWEYTDGPGENQRVMVVHAVGETVYAGTIFTGMYRTTNGGWDWEQMETLEATNVRCIQHADSLLIVGSIGIGVSVSTDDGITWQHRNAGFSDVGDAIFVPSIAASSLGWIAYQSGSGLYRSLDHGITWTMTETQMPLDQITFLWREQVLWAATEKGLYSTTDLGATWIPASGGPFGMFVGSIIDHHGTIVAGSEQGLWMSDDDGTTWTKSSAQLPSNVGMLAVSYDSAIVVSTYSGTYLTSNMGESWTTLAGKIASTMPFTLTRVGSVLYAGSFNGVYTLALPATSVSGGIESAAVTITPNPSDGDIVIRLPEHVGLPCAIEVLDNVGRVVMRAMLTSTVQRLDVPLAQGLYTIRSSDAGMNRFSQRVVIR